MKLPLAALALMLVLVAGCGSRSLVGEWEVEGPALDSVTFRQDSSFEAGVDRGPIKASMSGVYSMDSNRITLTPQAFKVIGVSDPTITAAVEKELKKPMTLTVEWRSDQEVHLIPDDAPSLTLRRRQ